MALFDGEDFEEDINPYLADSAKGIALVRALISTEKETLPSSDFDEILQQEILPLIAELELQNETEIYRALKKISDRISEQKKVQILEGKKIVGVGGKFSSGKSCFINSITNATLPEGQKPTTSIATYIVNSERANNIAITNGDECVEIDDDAVEALAHAFYEKYNIGFSKLLKNLVVYTPDFTYPNIAILDTPGYSKSDTNKSDDSSDAEIAREQLKSVDYLIWLVDSNQGAITQRDLDFMYSLNVKNDVLVVFTKASMRTESDLKKIIGEAKKTLKNANRNVFDVIAYDSLLKKEVIGEGCLDRFFGMINSKIDVSGTTEQQLISIRDLLDLRLHDLFKELSVCDRDTSKIITDTNNVGHINSIIIEYIRNKAYLDTVNRDKINLNKSMNKLIACYRLEVGSL